MTIKMKDKFNMVGQPLAAKGFDIPGLKGARAKLDDLMGQKNLVIVLLRSKY